MKSSSGKLKKIVILVLILAVPGFLYYLLTAKGKNRYKPLAIYGPKVVAKTFHTVHGKPIPDTVYHKISAYALTDQDGKQVSLEFFNDKIVIYSFFYTHCPTLCKEQHKNLSLIAKNYVKNRMIHFVSITVDPDRDSVPVLKNYARQFGVNTDKWRFVTGDTTAIYKLARAGLLVNALKVGNNDFIYSDKLILVDADKRIRGYYSGTSVTELTRLNDEIKVQITEELRKIKAPN